MDFSTTWWAGLLIPAGIGFGLYFIQMSEHRNARITFILTSLYIEGLALFWAAISPYNPSYRLAAFLAVSSVTLILNLWMGRYIRSKELAKLSERAFVLPKNDGAQYALLKTPDLELLPLIDASHNPAGSTYFARLRVKNLHNKSIFLNPKIRLKTARKAYPLVLADQPTFTSFNLDPFDEEIVAVAHYQKGDNKIILNLPDELNNHRHISPGAKHIVDLVFTSPNLQPYKSTFILFVNDEGLQLLEATPEDIAADERTSQPLPNLIHVKDDISHPQLLQLDVNYFRRVMGGGVDGFFPIQVCFENQLDPSREVGAVQKVRAEISYGEFATPLELINVKNGCWIDEHLPDVDFLPGQRHYLLLGFFKTAKQGDEPQDTGINVYEYSRDLHRPIETTGLQVPKGLIGLRNPRRIIVNIKLIPQDRQDLISSFKLGFEAYGYLGVSLPVAQ